MLWTAQLVLSFSFLWSGYMKLFTPATQLALMWPWVVQVPRILLVFTGVIDWAAAIGLVLPAALPIKPRLTVATSAGIVLLMICASIFHIIRNETSSIWVNIVFGLLAAFIFWGRNKS